MFARRLHIAIDGPGSAPRLDHSLDRQEATSLDVGQAAPEALHGRPVPLAWLDNFAMRNFTNQAVFDDTLPLADGLMEAGFRVPVPALTAAMESWFLRKGWLRPGEQLRITGESCE